MPTREAKPSSEDVPATRRCNDALNICLAACGSFSLRVFAGMREGDEDEEDDKDEEAREDWSPRVRFLTHYSLRLTACGAPFFYPRRRFPSRKDETLSAYAQPSLSLLSPSTTF